MMKDKFAVHSRVRNTTGPHPIVLQAVSVEDRMHHTDLIHLPLAMALERANSSAAPSIESVDRACSSSTVKFFPTFHAEAAQGALPSAFPDEASDMTTT